MSLAENLPQKLHTWVTYESAKRREVGPLAEPDHLRQLDFNIYASSQIELHQSVNSGGVGLHDIQEALVGAHLKLLARFLIDVRSAVNAELLDFGRQRNGAADERTGATGGVRDFASSLVQHAMIERLEANADILSFHVLLPMRKSQRKSDHPACDFAEANGGRI